MISTTWRALTGAGLVAVGLALTTPTASAADKVDKTTVKAAKKLEGEGLAAYRAKDWTTALEKYRAAERLVHAASTTLGEARAMVQLGQLASAQKMYSQLASEAKTLKPPPPADAAKEAAALSKRVPHVTVNVTGVDASVATVTVDGEAVQSDWLGVPYGVDPGKHYVHGEAPDKAAVDQEVTVAEAESQTVTLAFGAAKPAETSTATTSSTSPESGGSGKTRKTVGEVMMIAGGVGVAFGAVTGILAIKKHSSLDPYCPDQICTTRNTGAIETYHRQALLSTVGFIAGGAVGVAGLVLFLLPTKSDPPKDSAPKSGFRVEPIVGIGSIGARGVF